MLCRFPFAAVAIACVLGFAASPVLADVGVGAKPADGADVLLDGSREKVDSLWTYWEGPGFKSSLPVKWKIVEDPVDGGTCLMTDDPAAAGGRFGAADLVTKKGYRDFRLHVEFLVSKPGGNSGVYLQNRYEIQVLDGDRSPHGMGAIINQSESPYDAYNGAGAWNSYDVLFRAARFKDGKLTEKARATVYFNGMLVHENVDIQQVHGGPNSGVDGGNEGGAGITDTAEGLKLQCEGHDVRYRNTWIKELKLEDRDTSFDEPLAIASSFPQGEKPTELFDGKTLEGWEGDEHRWSVVSGMIRGANDDVVASSTYLFTKKPYRDFRMVFDVRQTMGPEFSTMHSAVAALGERITDAGDNQFGFKGPLLMFCHDWGIWDAHRRNRVVEPGRGPEVERKGEWNRIEILVKGNRIRFAANGVEIFDFEDKPEMLQASPLGLQLHANDKPQEYRFRHVILSENPSEDLITVKKSQ